MKGALAFKKIKWLLLLISITLVMLLVMNYTTVEKSYKQIIGSFVPVNSRHTGLDVNFNIKSCTTTEFGVKDMESVAKYQKNCSVHHLTKVSKKISNPDGVSPALLSIAKTPWASPCECPRSLKLANFSISKTCLLSFPGSGNSWMRHLIQQITGIHSGSVYVTSEEKYMGFPYEGVVDGVSIIKNHRPPDRNGWHSRKFGNGAKLTVQFDQILILIRNPYSALIAEFKRSGLDLGKVGNTVIDTKSHDWISFFKARSKNWGESLRGSFNTSLPLMAIYYEDVRSCMLPELLKVASFLSNKDLNEFSFCCALKEREGHFHRPSSNQTIEDVYSLQDRKVMNNVILETAVVIEKSYPDVARRILRYVLP